MLNSHNDQLIENAGKGADIASQRFDDLDRACLDDAGIRMQDQGTLVLADVGCGRCGFINEVRRNIEGAVLLAIDIEDFSEFAAEGVDFIQNDVRETAHVLHHACDVLYSQRTIHYLTHQDASGVLHAFRRSMAPGGSLYLSASGMQSELADGYAGADLPVQERHHYLSPEMQEKHGIRQRVCLYSQEELLQLVMDAGFSLVSVTQSEFGNIKLVGVLA